MRSPRLRDEGGRSDEAALVAGLSLYRALNLVYGATAGNDLVKDVGKSLKAAAAAST